MEALLVHYSAHETMHHPTAFHWGATYSVMADATDAVWATMNSMEREKTVLEMALPTKVSTTSAQLWEC